MNGPPDREGEGEAGRGRTHDDPLERLRQFERERGYDEVEDEKEGEAPAEECKEEPSEDEPQS